MSCCVPNDCAMLLLKAPTDSQMLRHYEADTRIGIGIGNKTQSMSICAAIEA